MTSHHTPPRNRRGRRLRWLLALLPIVLAAAGTYWLLHSSMLTVQDVRVRGTESLDQASLVEISGLQGTSMLRLPLKDAQERLLAIPQVRSVSFSRNWPDGVTIEVDERQPAAFWSAGGRDYAVDGEGVVLGGGAPSGPAPRIVEVDSDRILSAGDRVHPDAIALAKRIFKESPRFLGESVDVLEYRPSIGVTVVFHGGMKVTFGDERSYEYKVAVLAELLETLSAQGKAPKAVDLRFGERVTYE
jgi:cell division protein FtsQ